MSNVTLGLAGAIGYDSAAALFLMESCLQRWRKSD